MRITKRQYNKIAGLFSVQRGEVTYYFCQKKVFPDFSEDYFAYNTGGVETYAVLNNYAGGICGLDDDHFDSFSMYM